MKTVTMGHGGGGGLMAELIETFLADFRGEYLKQRLDSAVLPEVKGRIAFTTDFYVIRPLFFPGGDIGRLAVCGTVNDLAVVGAVPRYLSCALILEEGFPLETLAKVTASMAAAAAEAGVEIVTGDTKVVEKGHGDGVFINTAGIGFVPDGRDVTGSALAEGDILLVSGTLGDHAMTILSLRESLGFESSLSSDSAPLSGMIDGLLASNAAVRFMRDLTRGGLAAALNELAELRRFSLEIDEESLPIRDEVRSLSELLGIDVASMANEGKILIAVRAQDADKALAALRSHPYGRDAVRIGRVLAPTGSSPRVGLKSPFGGTRILGRPYAEKLPRIC